ncbi:MAG: hypothetical protein H6Q90_4364, partial [Deltaproteobacteria bacterium]|nr:hypothetical protein [Deltaproteobacteria bacterium]
DGRTGDELRRIDNPVPAGQLFGHVTPRSNGNFVISSEFNPSHGVVEAGTAHLYDPTGALIAELVPPSRREGDNFGGTLTIAGEVIAIAAAGADSHGIVDQGRVWLFSATDGALLGEIEDPEPDTGDHFGHLSLVPLPHHFAIGAINDTVDGVEEAGTVYLFEPLQALGARR